MKIGPEIIVEVSPDRFIFSMNEKHFQIDTCINFTTKNGKIIPTNIGERKEIPGITLVHLFNLDNLNTNDYDKYSLLLMFMEYNIGKMFEDKWFPGLRPRVIFKGDNRLRHLLCGYQRALLEEIAMLGGARDVRFE